MYIEKRNGKNTNICGDDESCGVLWSQESRCSVRTGGRRRLSTFAAVGESRRSVPFNVRL